MSDDEPTPSKEERDWSKVLEWIEKQGQESLASRFNTADSIAKEAATTLTVLLAGIAGTAAYGAKVLDAGSLEILPLASAITCAYLVGLAVFLVWRCMRFESYPARYQQPKHLMQPTFSLVQLREAELHNLDERIVEAAAINRRRAARLNKLRIATALTPLVFGAAVAVARVVGAAPHPADKTSVCEVSIPASSPPLVTLRCQNKG